MMAHLTIFDHGVAAQIAQMAPRHNRYALRENIIGNFVPRNLNAQIIFTVADNIHIGGVILLAWRRNFTGFQICHSEGNRAGQGAEFF